MIPLTKTYRMKRLALLAWTLLALAACKHKPASPQTHDDDSLKVVQAHYVEPQEVSSKQIVDSAGNEDDLDQYADYYIVVADTGKNYYALRDTMLKLHDTTGIAIDTMGRYYNKKKDLIMVPEDDEDDVIAGDYYPRRGPSQTLSLEYLNTYTSDADPKMMALVRGIYEDKASADKALRLLPWRKAFVFKGKVYVGCLH